MAYTQKVPSIVEGYICMNKTSFMLMQLQCFCNKYQSNRNSELGMSGWCYTYDLNLSSAMSNGEFYLMNLMSPFQFEMFYGSVILWKTQSEVQNYAGEHFSWFIHAWYRPTVAAVSLFLFTLSTLS